MQKLLFSWTGKRKKITIPHHNKPVCEGELKILQNIFNDVVAKLRLTSIRTWPASLGNEVNQFKKLYFPISVKSFSSRQ